MNNLFTEISNIQNNLQSQPIKETNQSIYNFKEAMKKANYLTSLFKGPEISRNNFPLEISTNSYNNNLNKSNFLTPRSTSFLQQMNQKTPTIKSSQKSINQIQKINNKNIPLDYEYDLNQENYDEDSFDIDNITSDLEHFKNENLMENNPNEEEKREKEHQKLLVSNHVLTDSNLDLKNKNKILEKELKNYKSNPIFAIQKSAYDESLLKFINGLKNNFIENLKKNEDLMNEILTEQNELKNINEDFSTIQNQLNEAAINFDDFNKENAELQTMIEQKEADIKNLEENIKIINNMLKSFIDTLNERQDTIFSDLYEEYNYMLKICPIFEQDFKETFNDFKQTYQMSFTISDLFNEIFWPGFTKNDGMSTFLPSTVI